jgi:hypothetical protein
MIERILLLTTVPGDVVLDPFAGSGTTLSVADFLKRKWFGFEMNKEYCETFGKIKEETKLEMMIERKRNDKLELLRNQFEQKIKNLRLVKFPKSLMRELYRSEAFVSLAQPVSAIFAFSGEHQKDGGDLSKIPSNKFMTEDIFLIMNNNSETEFLRKQINTVISRAPLSKFGIEPRIFLRSRDEFISNQENATKDLNLWLYSFGVVHKFERPITFSEWISENESPQWNNYLKNGVVPPILSNVQIYQEIPKTWISREEQLEKNRKWVKEIIGGVSQDHAQES